MKVGFFTVLRRDPQHYLCANVLVRSVRACMPGVPIVHLTDEVSPPVLGVDEVRRKPHGKMLGVRLQHYAECEGNWLLLDTDCLVQKDVRVIFAGWTGIGDSAAFDIALADRNWPHLPQTEEMLRDMPWNTGVAFSRNTKFWAEVSRLWHAQSDEQQRDWFSEQRVAAQVVRSGQFRFRELPGAVYNYPPVTGVEDAAILHFKGPRKAKMLERGALLPSAPIAPAAPQGLMPILPPAPPPRRRPDGPVRVFIGYDPRQPVAFAVAAHSVASACSLPVQVTRLQLSQLPITRRGLTEFTYSRFLVPWLCGFEGWGIFIDADTLCLGDISELLATAQQADTWRPVHVVQHERRFEWPSVMVFDNVRCKALTPAAVGGTADLFDFKWANGPVGQLPPEWNFLVGYDDPARVPAPKLVHFTQGVPVWPETAACDYAREWQAALESVNHTVPFQELMGSSVHVRHMPKLAEARA